MACPNRGRRWPRTPRPACPRRVTPVSAATSERLPHPGAGVGTAVRGAREGPLPLRRREGSRTERLPARRSRSGCRGHGRAADVRPHLWELTRGEPGRGAGAAPRVLAWDYGRVRPYRGGASRPGLCAGRQRAGGPRLASGEVTEFELNLAGALSRTAAGNGIDHDS
jgi:hypothetical protein